MSVTNLDSPTNAIRFLDADTGRTPVLALDLSIVANRYLELTEAIPDAQVFYAMKANPHPAVIGLLATMGCGIDRAPMARVTAGCRAGMLHAIQPPKPCPTMTARSSPRLRTIAAASAVAV